MSVAPHASGTAVLPSAEEDDQTKLNHQSSTSLSIRSMLTKYGPKVPFKATRTLLPSFLILEKGERDKTFMRYLTAPTIVISRASSSTKCPHHPFHLLEISNKAAFTRSHDLDGPALSAASDMSYTAVSFHSKDSPHECCSQSLPPPLHPSRSSSSPSQEADDLLVSQRN